MTDWSALIAQEKAKVVKEPAPVETPGQKWSKLIANEKSKQRNPVLSQNTKTEKVDNIAVEGEAPFQVHAVAAASENPEQIIGAYAKHRFPSLSPENAKKRYYMKDNEVFYIDNDGVERKEDRETGVKKAIENFDPGELKGKQLGAKVLLEAPPAVVAAGTQLATGNPILAAGAAGAARTVETGIAQLLADREPEYKEMLSAGGTEAVASILGDFIAKRGIKAFDALRNSTATGTQKTIKKVIGEEIPGMKLPESQAAIDEIARIARENNIPIDMAQLLQSQKAANLQKSILLEGGAGAEILKKQGKETADASYNALTKQVSDISPGTQSRLAASQDLTKTAEKARQELVDARTTEAEKLYKQAWKEQKPVETAPVIKSIDVAIKDDVARGGRTERALKKIRNMLVMDAPESHPSVIEIDRMLSTIKGPTKEAESLMKVRDKLTKGAGVLENRLHKLDSAKKEIGAILNEGKIPPEQSFYLTNVVNNLTKQMDEVNPIYKMARDKFAELSDPVNAFDKTILDVVRKLEGDNVIKAPKRIFSADFSNPESILVAKAFIKKHNPQAWDASVRVFMEQELDKIGDFMSGRGIAEAYRKKIWKPQMKSRLKVALDPEQFKRLDDFMGLVKNLGISIDTNSDTAMKLATTDERKKMAGGKLAGGLRKIGNITDLLKGNLKDIARTIEDARDPEFSRQLAIAFTSNDLEIIRAVNRIKKINPKTENYLRSFASLISTITGRVGYQKMQSDKYGSKEDVIKKINLQKENK